MQTTTTPLVAHPQGDEPPAAGMKSPAPSASAVRDLPDVIRQQADTGTSTTRAPRTGVMPLRVSSTGARAPPVAAQRSKTARTGASAGLEFIHIARPDEPYHSKKLSQVRSHVAKQIHAQRRQKQAGSSHKSRPVPLPGSASLSAIDLQERRARERGGTRSTYFVLDNVEAGHALSRQRGESYEAEDDWSSIPSPPTLSPTRIVSESWGTSALSCFAWPLSQPQYRLFDFYTKSVLYQGYSNCFENGVENTVIERKKRHYIPFCMTHPWLLAGLLYVSANRYSRQATSAEERSLFSLHAMQYRVMCIGRLREALASGQAPSDELIFLCLMMTSEASFDRDLAGRELHGNAILDMVRMRGGVHHVTLLSGLLRFLLVTCIFEPKHRWVCGPVED